MPRLSAPFGLSERIRKPDTDLDATALGTVLLIALMLGSLVGSRFVYSPGVTVDFTADGKPAPLNLPVASASVRLSGVLTSDTVTLLALKYDDMAIWNGRIMKLADLDKDFRAKPRKAGEILLIKVDRQVSTQATLRVVSLAKQAGFAGVQLACEEAPKARD